MPSNKSFKCLHCRKLHPCDRRNRGRQHFCAKPGCRKASKAASQRRWTAKEENQNYFRGSDNVERVRRWRAAHPGYWRKMRPRQQDALQEFRVEQDVVVQGDAAEGTEAALEDICSPQAALMVGLISVLTGHALQEDIAARGSFKVAARTSCAWGAGSPPNLKTGVLRHPIGQKATFHPRYLDFAARYGFEPRACNVRKANEKGRVENAVGYVKEKLPRRAGHPAGPRRHEHRGPTLAGERRQ